MALTITHQKVSAVADDADPNSVSPSDWNAVHTVAGTLDTSNVADDAVTFGKVQNIATDRLLGRDSPGTGDVEELTPTEVTAMLDVVGTSTQGLAPASGGGTSNFLRADGTWASPGGSGAPGGLNTHVQFNDSSSFGGSSKFTFNKTSGAVVINDAASAGAAGGGLTVGLRNPTTSGTSSYSQGVVIGVTYDNNLVAVTEPNFANVESLTLAQVSKVGQNVHGGATTAKKTFLPFHLTHTAQAAGQKFCQSLGATYYSMGDSFIESVSLTYAGGPISGDEGTGWSSVSYLSQYTGIVTTTISSVPAQATLNTTTTQAITGSKDIQTVTVASATGAAVGDWVVVGQELPTHTINIEAVELTAVETAPHSISGRFICNHASGTTITPALKMVVGDTSFFGEQRVLVNLSGTSHTTGTIASSSGGTLVGTGTNWTTGMVGGSALNVGAISIAADDFTGAPFDTGANRLRSWYQITAVTDTTHLGIFSTTVAGDASYRGTASGAYTVRPAARILRIDGTTVICETSTHTWTAGDSIEQALCPYPDVTGYQWRVKAWTPGGTYRSVLDITNGGGRTFDVGIGVRQLAFVSSGGGDSVAYDRAFWADNCNYGFVCENAQSAGLKLASIAGSGATSDNSSKIEFGGAHLIFNSTNEGMDFETCFTGGLLRFVSTTKTPLTDTAQMSWQGYFTVGKFIDVSEMTAPTAPSANGARIYAEDNGAGKTRLMVRFATGAAVQIAIEP